MKSLADKLFKSLAFIADNLLGPREGVPVWARPWFFRLACIWQGDYYFYLSCRWEAFYGAEAFYRTEAFYGAEAFFGTEAFYGAKVFFWRRSLSLVSSVCPQLWQQLNLCSHDYGDSDADSFMI